MLEQARARKTRHVTSRLARHGIAAFYKFCIIFFALGSKDPKGYKHEAKIKSWSG